MQRRTFLKFGAGVTAHATGPLYAQRQPLRIVIGFSAGGSTDLVGRLVGDALGTAVGRTVIVENKTGASGRIAIETVKSAPDDGNTLLLAPHGAMTLFPHLYKTLRYEPTKDFTPISRITTSDYSLAVSAQSPARDVPSFRQWAKTQGGELSFGSPGAGTVLHFPACGSARGSASP
jgi:tripartite-type tricarboxylate transporter receptor subunit TctC